ncbi:hypothetical protein CDAR_612381 [Caerostris darwini]|uniref:Uncharacterized protein n=1 Tax=Caerostris darwini TaxID=1538125 RepID=A0AAV4SHI5_9ARAC|nr:hypothetical protein CDAR_612381 [Caerostris darwini]
MKLYSHAFKQQVIFSYSWIFIYLLNEVSVTNGMLFHFQKIFYAVLSPRHVVESEEKPKTALLIALANESFSFNGREEPFRVRVFSGKYPF